MDQSTEYSLKLASRPFQRAVITSLIVFLVVNFGRYIIPKSSFDLPASTFPMVVLLSKVCFVIMLVVVLAFVFYRKQVKITIDEQGIHFPMVPFIFWKSIHWYRVDVFASKIGIKRVILKTDYGKVVLLAEEGEALFQLVDDIQQQLSIYNPLAKDYKELKSSRIKAYILIFILTAIHVTICVLTNYEKKFLLISIPLLLIIVWAILLEHIHKPVNKSQV